ncbi:hypothetical protein GYMLUDRAFT_43226 [Collybiopsis luxurians FD-317 M1]|uniref:Asteroid domain-containing protein n=1 Tax=Collybiopsis luxurians FD-317 M1 TaxID=944289 RepID=A0A0D0BZ46_9AGAR|nr:hypothetical protein GYMLUDRAFT_43226 [Collybiopsis luxurians FD-317 M1]
MGVHGLTTFLRENRKLSETLNLPSESQEPTHLVIDGWSFIYAVLHKSNLPWVYGGEYVDFAQSIRRVIRAWFSVGVSGLSFVFDGPFPALKHQTILSRSTKSHVHPTLLFFRTSPTARSSPRYLNDPESRIFPPLCYPVTVQTLLDLRNELGEDSKLDVVFADSEGDPFAVELAARIGAYVVANDSDYAILNAEGYKGWIPLEGIVWSALSSKDEDLMESPEEGGWQSTSKPSSSNRNRNPSSSVGFGRGIIPPDSPNLSLSFIVHTPSLLASTLNIPVTLLPLLGALLGNDFSNPNLSNHNQIPSYSSSSKSKSPHQHLFFESGLPLSARINRVALTLSLIITAAKANTPHKKQKHQVDSVMDLISKSVKALLIRGADSMTSGELDGVIEGVVESTLQYAIPQSEAQEIAPPHSLCPLHEPEYCQLIPIFSRNVERVIAEAEAELAGTGQLDENIDMDGVNDDDLKRHPISIDSDLEKMISEKVRVRDTLIDAYRLGYLSPPVLNALTPSISVPPSSSSSSSSSVGSGTLWTKLFLENPDLESTPRLTRRIRMWMCAVLDDAVGLPEAVEEPEEEESPQHGDEGDEDDEEEDEEEDEEDTGDPDELIDVIESGSDSSEDEDGPDVLAPLKGALHRLHHPDLENHAESSTANTEDDEAEVPKRRVVVTEYVRQGTRVVGESVEVPELGEVLRSIGVELAEPPKLVSPRFPRRVPGNGTPTPFLLRPASERLDIFLRLLTTSNTSSSSYPTSPSQSEPDNTRLLDLLHNLPPSQLCLALAFRWLMTCLASKANEARSRTADQQQLKPDAKQKSNTTVSTWNVKERQELREKMQARWTEREARCLLAAFDWGSESQSDFTGQGQGGGQSFGYPPLHERSIQLTVQILVCLDSVHQLAEVMLLTGDGANSRVAMPAHLFSGRKFHAYLADAVPLPDSPEDNRLWEACSYGFGLGDGMGGEVFADEMVKGGRKKNKKDKVDTTTSKQGNGKGGGGKGKGSARGGGGAGKGSLFDLLGDVEA